MLYKLSICIDLNYGWFGANHFGGREGTGRRESKTLLECPTWTFPAVGMILSFPREALDRSICLVLVLLLVLVFPAIHPDGSVFFLENKSHPFFFTNSQFGKPSSGSKFG